MSKKSEVTSEDILKDYSAAVQNIVQRLRKIIKNTIPAAIEMASANGIGYRHPKAGFFGGISPRQDKVYLVFEYGAHLPDPDRLLKMPPVSGEQVRYIEMFTEQDIREDELVALLHAAISFKSG